jgi:hypothetical protein
MINVNLGQKIKTSRLRALFNFDNHLDTSFVTAEKTAAQPHWSEIAPGHDALLLCNALKTGTLNEYFAWLENRPAQEISAVFLGIIDAKSSGLPIICEEEIASVQICGVSLEPVQNIQARMLTKITLLLLVESESQKLGIWHELIPRWLEKYQMEVKSYVRILEGIIQQCENSAHADKVPQLRHSIELIKDANRQYAINW